MPFLLIACAAEDSAVEAEEWADPSQPGPWAAGTYEAALVGQTGVDLRVQVWYPTEETGDDLHKYDGLVTSGAIDEAEPACATPRPVMMFSHGSGGVRWQSWYWTEYLATHGWIVVAPDHTGNTTFDDDESRVWEWALRRPLDVADSYDWLLGELPACVDEDAGYAMSGHSFGAYTTLVVSGAVIDIAATQAECGLATDWMCDDVAAWALENPDTPTIDLTDARSTLGIAMAPAAYQVLVGGLAARTKPALVWGGDLDDITPMATQVQPIYDALGAQPADLAVLAGAGHFVFSNACDILDTYADCGAEYLQGEVAHPIIRTTSLAFLQQQMGREDAPLPPTDSILTWSSRGS